ncbi:MAG: hypothetical protein ACKO37_08900 [Vampirovibrionales bacterium]
MQVPSATTFPNGQPFFLSRLKAFAKPLASQQASSLVPAVAESVVQSTTLHMTPQVQTLPSQAFDPATRRIAKFMDVIAGNRTRAMIVEDFFGMGLLRTLVDSSRGFMGGNNHFSPVAGLDRILREGFSILTDNVMSGIVANEIGKAHAFPHFANQYPSRAVLTHVHHHMERLAPFFREKETPAEGVVQKLSHAITHDIFNHLVKPSSESLSYTSAQESLRERLHETVSLALGRTPQPEETFKTKSAELMHQLGKKEWRIALPQPDGRVAHLPLPTYLEELHSFTQGLRQAMPALHKQHPQLPYWGDVALKYAEQTTRVKDRQLWGIIAGMTASFVSPALINSFMNHAFHVKGYPAENALKVQKPVQFITSDTRPDTLIPRETLKEKPASPTLTPTVPKEANLQTIPLPSIAKAETIPTLATLDIPPPEGGSTSDALAGYLGGTTNGVSGQFLASETTAKPRFGESSTLTGALPNTQTPAIGSSEAEQANASLPSAELERKYSDSWYTRLLQQGYWGKPLKLSPLLLLPLVPASGVFNTQELKLYLPQVIRKMLPQQVRDQVGKYTVEYLKSTYDFCKNFPHTTQQQMAGGFALLIMSRLLNSRTPNEFRERAVDGYGGWGFWILGTPLLQKYIFGPLADKTFGSQLMYKGRLRHTDEIKHLMPQGLTQQKTLKANTWVGFTAMMTNVLLLGILEPYIAALWTKSQLAKAQDQGKLNADVTLPSQR